MSASNHQPLSVLVYSSGNLHATLLTAGLLHGRPNAFGAILVQGVLDVTPISTVVQVLAEVGNAQGGWVPQLVSKPLAEAIDVGLTICVPT